MSLLQISWAHARYVSGACCGLSEHSMRVAKSLEHSVTGSCDIRGIQRTSSYVSALTWSKVFLKATSVCHTISSQ